MYRQLVADTEVTKKCPPLLPSKHFSSKKQVFLNRLFEPNGVQRSSHMPKFEKKSKIEQLLWLTIRRILMLRILPVYQLKYVHVVQLREEGTTLHNTVQDLNIYRGIFSYIAWNYVQFCSCSPAQRRGHHALQYCSGPRYMEEYSVIQHGIMFMQSSSEKRAPRSTILLRT